MGFTFNEFPWTKYYDSDLREVLKYMKTFEETLSSYDETIEELKEALEGIDDMESRISDLETATSDLSDIRSRLTDLENLHATDIANLQSQIDTLADVVNTIETTTTNIKTYVDSRDNVLKADYNQKFYQVYVDMWTLFNGLKDRVIALAELVAQIDTMAYNPWARSIEKVSLQTNLNYAYADLADMVLTAEEYSELGLSATEYNTRDLTAYEYSVRGRKWFHMDFIYSPVYGFKQDISNVLTSIINYIKGTLSADEYSALNLSAESYTNLDMTAVDYYSYGSSGYLGLGGNGLTASQYSTIDVVG